MIEATLTQLERTSTYLVYCRTQNRSGAVTSMLRRPGFEKASVLRGGFLAWPRRGFSSEPQPGR
ncbi:MAG: rhodanese-like domain-containing protein [Holophagae bacterium]|nr:rhodanese-like domain-containing protein [Holophagae bacterium]